MLLVACEGGADRDTTGPAEENTMDVTSDFDHEQPIPTQYTCDGENISPPLTLSEPPEGTRTLALIMDDPDAPSGIFVHWVAYDIAPTTEIPEDVSDLGTSGTNSSGSLGYTGPCPPSGIHRYFFRVFALDTELGLDEGASREQVLDAIEGHVLAQGTLMGTYQR